MSPREAEEVAAESSVRVAVIDSGVNASHPHVGAVETGVGFDRSGQVLTDCLDVLGHGTAVSAAVHSLAPPAVIVPIKVFDRVLNTSVRALIAAIDWAASRDVALVNLSLGTSEPSEAPALRAAVDRARAVGTVVVAAGEHEGIRWLPGTLDDVVRVELDWDCPRETYRWVRRNGVPVFRTSGHPRSIPGVDPSRNLKGLSFAVANMTGHAARAIMETGARGFDDLVARLMCDTPEG